MPEVSITDCKANSPPVVKNFTIKNLYGYRTLSLNTKNAASILIARNGSGKTTLLGALDAFLKCHFHRLAELDFEKIECQLQNSDRVLTLSRSAIISYLESAPSDEVNRAALRLGVEPTALLKFMQYEYLQLSSEDRLDHKIFRAFYEQSNYSPKLVKDEIQHLTKTLLPSHPEIQTIQNEINRILKGFEVIYLPTYRRIEIPLSPDSRDNYARRRRRKLNISYKGLYSSDIQFGLSDIGERLRDLDRQIIIESNQGYSELSANILNELIDGATNIETAHDHALPLQSDLRLFFERLSRGDRIGPFPSASVPNIERIYADDNIPTKSQPFLRYFLNKLRPVVEAAKKVEKPVDDFIEVCNRYLIDDPTLVLDDGFLDEVSEDSKRLRLDRIKFRLRVETIPEEKPISLDALSSGEKQMISLFAKLYLYPGNKIILIDEPELSLSIDWQTRILVDILKAPLCSQMIAITHSPFVFENELEPFASKLDITIDRDKLSEISLGSESEDLGDF